MGSQAGRKEAPAEHANGRRLHRLPNLDPEDTTLLVLWIAVVIGAIALLAFGLFRLIG